MPKKRKNGTGTVRKRTDERWEGRQVISYDDKDLPKTKSVLAKIKAECVAKLKKLQSEFETAKTEAVKTNMTFGQWLNVWYEYYSKPKL